MIYHILNGDGLASKFDLPGEGIICRETLISGNIKADNLSDFWKLRADFIQDEFGNSDYFEKVVSEFEKLNFITENDEVNLWFGNDAFCQVNMWFCLSLLFGTPTKVYRIFPDSEGWDCNFKDLEKCSANRQPLTIENIKLGADLWKAFSKNDLQSLKELSKTETKTFLKLDEVCLALIEIETKPKEILQEISANNEISFGQIFQQFRQKAGVYGFGDTQVRKILEQQTK